MKKIFLLLVFPFYLLAMQPDDRIQAQSLRPASCRDAILQLRNCKFKIALASALSNGRPPKESFFDTVNGRDLPNELLIPISQQMNDVIFKELKEPKLIHAIDYIADTISGQLSLHKSEHKNKLQNILCLVESYPKQLRDHIKSAYMLKYRWKYKSTLSRSSNTIWLNMPTHNPKPNSFILDNQKISSFVNGNITVTDLRTNQEIFRTQMTFSNPQLQLFGNQPNRIAIIDPTNKVVQIVWTLFSDFDSFIAREQKQTGQGEKRKRRYIVKNGLFVRIPEDKKEEKGSSQNPKKKRK